MSWEKLKKGFDTWEGATAKYFEVVLKNPLVLSSSGQLLTAGMKAKAKYERTVAQCWSRLGLPTRRDQERALHALNQVQSQLLDLEEKLADLQPRDPPLKAKRPSGVDARS